MGFSLTDGPLGTHSMRKFGSSHCRKNGCSKDEKDYRGRWKKARTSDVYDDIELPYPDAKVCDKLCIGGPCKYVIRENCGLSEDFILQYVTPNIKKRFPREVALILGYALMWVIFSPNGKDVVPESIYDRVTMAFASVRRGDENLNPIRKIPLVVTGNDGQVYIVNLLNGLSQMKGLGIMIGNQFHLQFWLHIHVHFTLYGKSIKLD